MARIRKKLGAALVGVAALSLTLTACGGGGVRATAAATSEGGAIDTSTATGEINYWLWDANQQPAYQACADAFQTANPNINVKISQYGWDDYWSKLTNGFVAGDAPDVFTDHLAKYPEFVSQQQLLAARRHPGQGRSTPTSTSPAWPTCGRARTASATACRRTSTPSRCSTTRSWSTTPGIHAADLQDLTWNPTDGGTYEKAIAHLTVDKNGKRGDEPGFDKTKVKVYGLGLDGGSGGGVGQTQWSMYTGTNGLARTPTRTRGARTTTTTTPSSRRPSAGSLA